MMIRILVFIICFALYECLTRYACLTTTGSIGQFGSSDESEDGIMLGSLSCVTKPNTKILVTRIIQGYGNYRGCANPDHSCDREIFSDINIASACDGRVSCFIRTYAMWLEKCSIMGDFVHVEYECVTDSSIFDICKEDSRTVSESSVYIVSPNVFQIPTAETSWKVCECIATSKTSEQIIADYVHSDIYASTSECSESRVLIESKLSPEQTTVDKAIEICGQRTVSNQMFRGSVRMTYNNRRESMDDGFLTKLRVPPLETGTEISMHCGPVISAGTFVIKRNQYINSMMNNGENEASEEVAPNGANSQPPWITPQHNNGPWDTNAQNQNGAVSHTFSSSAVDSSLTQISSANLSIQEPRDPRKLAAEKPLTPDFLGINTDQSNSESAVNSQPETTSELTKKRTRKGFIPFTNPKPQKKDFIPWPPIKPESIAAIVDDVPGITAEEQAGLPPSIEFLSKGKQMKISDTVTENRPGRKDELPKGNVIAYIIGGTGAGLIGLCLTALYFLYTKRRRSRSRVPKSPKIEKREQVVAKPTEHVDFEEDPTYVPIEDDDPTYVLPSEISTIYRCGDQQQGHVNNAYNEDEQTTEFEYTGSIRNPTWKQSHANVSEAVTEENEEEFDEVIYDNSK